jgi:hypothetical protein
MPEAAECRSSTGVARWLSSAAPLMPPIILR